MTPWPFSVLCPGGHLASIRQRGSLPLVCATCGRRWKATERQRKRPLEAHAR